MADPSSIRVCARAVGVSRRKGGVVLSLRGLARRLGYDLQKRDRAALKFQAETAFWAQCLDWYVAWYQGEMAELYGEPPPTEDQKVDAATLEHRAILTWERVHQRPKYLQDLALEADSFDRERVLDVGSGPHLSGAAFVGARLYCLDPLFSKYLELGYPVHHAQDVRIVCAPSEDMPLEDDFFDAVIAVNSLDHVDDFAATVSEIRRVLKPGGKVRFHVHYHRGTKTEPLVLDDETLEHHFGWCHDFRKLAVSKRKRGHTLTAEDEWYALWSNF